MARITIIPSDNFVAVDGVSRPALLDFSTCGIPADVHALQWYDTVGEIEFDPPTPVSPKPQNQQINELPQWALNCVAVWDAWSPPKPSEEQPTVSGAQTL